LKFIPEITCNYNTLKDIWLSKDLSRINELPKAATLLDKTVPVRNKGVIQSFPKSGSALTRKYLEQIFLISTGDSTYCRLLGFPLKTEVMTSFLGN